MALQGCGDNHYYCGDGTEAVDGECVNVGTECGPNTHDEDGQCVLDDDVVVCGDGTEEVDGECVAITGRPPVLDTVSSPTPYPSGGLMILEGENFALSDSGTLVVTVDGVETTGVQVLTNHLAIADLPASTVVTVEVEISNDLGDDAMDFQYTGLFAAQGGAFDSGGPSPAFGPVLPVPELHIVDPRTGAVIVVGPVATDGGTVPRLVTAMKFDAAGTLWAIEAVLGVETEAALMTIDRTTGAATVVTTLSPDPVPPPPTAFGGPSGPYPAFPDMTFVDGTLYAWCEDEDDLMTIDQATGETTRLPNDLSTSGSGLVTLADGTVLGAFDADRLYALGTDGVEIGSAPVINNVGEVAGMTWLDGDLYGVITDANSGVVRIDPTTMEEFFIGGVVSYDALATPPELDGAPGATPDPLDPPGSGGGGGAKLALVRGLAPDLDLAAYEPITATPRPVPVRRALVAADVFAPIADAVTADARGRRGVALTDLVATDVVIRAERGELRLDREALVNYRLVENQRGQLKLVGLDGRPVLRRITQIEEN